MGRSRLMEQRRKRREALKAKSKPAAKPTGKVSGVGPVKDGDKYASSIGKKKDTSKTHVNRYATLKQHQEAVKARKTLKGGKNVGPVANADAYGSSIKPKKPSKPSTSSSKTSKPAPRSTPTKPSGKGGPKTSGGFPTTAVTKPVKSKSNGNGTYGKPLPSNPNLKGKQKITGRQNIQNQVNATVGGRIESKGYNKPPRKGSKEGRANIKAMVDSYGGNKKKKDNKK